MSAFIETAQQLHQQHLVADAHYDLLCMVYDKRIKKDRTKVIETDYVPGLRAGGVDLLICSLFVSDCYVPEMALRHALDQISCLYKELAESPHCLALCRNTTEIRSAHAEGKIAILLSFEGAEPLGNDLHLLRVFYELGVRGLGLVWSRRNYAGDGCFFAPREEGRKGGLTDWGVALVKEARRLGMYIDVSHLNDEGFADVCAFLDGPFMASHSNCRSLTDVKRNLTDPQIGILAERGGIMGLNVCSGFVHLDPVNTALGLKAPLATPMELATHGRYVKDLVGAAHLGFGFDFCDELNFDGPGHDSVKGHHQTPELTACLLEQGFSEEELKGVLGENLMTFLKRTIG